MKTENKISEIILAAIKEMDSKVGKGMLALVLKGSKDKKVYSRKLNESRFYGALVWYPIEVIGNFIRQLMEQKLIGIRRVGFYDSPVLSLSNEGEKALENKTEIPLMIEKRKKEIRLNESMKLTLELFKKYQSVEKVCQERNLVESTIYGHLENLIKLGKLAIDEVVDKEKQKRILKAKRETEEEGLKAIKELVPDISYGEIRCVLMGKD